MSKVSYPYAVGRIRALESGLIDPARWSRLREATREEAIRILSEAGYGNASSDPEQMIRAQEEETRRTIAELSPEPAWTELFLLPIDAHNLKVAYKGKVLGADVSHLFLEGGTVPADIMRVSVEAGEYSLVPRAFADAMPVSDEKLSLFEFSASVDRAVFAQIRSVLGKKKNAALSRYFSAQTDFLNVLSVLRASALGWSAERLAKVLIDGGSIPEETFLTALSTGQPAVMCTGDFEDSISEVLGELKQGKDLTYAESMFATRRVALLREEQDDVFSIAPVVCYLLERENEARELRVLFAAKS